MYKLPAIREVNPGDHRPANCHPREGGCHKKQKSLEPRRTRRPLRKRKALLCALRGSLLSEPFATPPFAGMTKSVKK